MVSALEVSIKAAIMRSIARQGLPQSVNSPSALDAFMADPATRGVSYNTALDIADEEHPKRVSVARLLATYLSGFPPEDNVLTRIEAACLRYATQHPTEEPILTELQRLAHAYLDVPPLQLVTAKQPTGHFRLGEAPSLAPQYTQMPVFLPLSREATRSRRVVTFPQFADSDTRDVVTSKNKDLRKDDLVLQHTQCRPYPQHVPLQIRKAALQQQLQLLCTYHDSYRTSPVVARASGVILKLMCDSYVSKIAVGFEFLREVSVSFANVFLRLLSSEYLCSRLHALDLLLTLAVHLQLVDARGVFPGLTEALQLELSWLTRVTVDRIVRMPEPDQGLWLAALKAALICAPHEGLAELDPRALKTWMLLPGVASTHPHIYSVLAKALAARLLNLCLSTPLDIQLCSGCARIRLPQAEVEECFGPNAATDILHLYEHAHTSAARHHLFLVLFALAASEHGAGDAHSAQGTITQLGRCLRVMLDLSLPWHMHALILHQSRSVAKDLPQQLSLDMDMQSARDIKQLVTTVLSRMLRLVAAYRRLPQHLWEMIAATAADFTALNQVGKEVCDALPTMIREDTDYSLTRAACQLTGHILRLLRSPQHDRNSGQDDATPQIMRVITSHPSVKVRAIAASVFASMGVVCRTNPRQAASFAELLRFMLPRERSVAQLMSLFYATVEGMAVQSGLVLPEDGDVASMAAAGTFTLSHGAAELVGARSLWLLYWGLRQSQLHAVQRARYTLLCILATIPQRGSPALLVSLWTKTMADPLPEAALVGSLQVVRLAAMHHHARYERAVSDVQRIDASKLASPFNLAACIWALVVADDQRK